jgi:chorismate mutase
MLPKTAWKKHNRQMLIAGPCSAESPRQFSDTLRGILPAQPDLVRAGIWKPRTRPGQFEGMGAPALGWAQRAAQQAGVPLVVEVASAEHVQLALEAGIRHVWIGARTTVNPFLVQEIATALTGSAVAVLVKNPVSPDIELWSGAIERFQKAGIEQLGAVHRGFTGFGRTLYRNHPSWEIPIELRRRFPDMLILCDPSHIAGDRLLVPEVAQLALDLEFDGLMVEAHVNPDEALSDTRQQLTPGALVELLAQLVHRQTQSSDRVVNLQLEQLRSRIDEVDARLMEVLQERMELVDEIGSVKEQYDITILQHERWTEILKTRQEWAAHLNPEFVRRLLFVIHQESIDRQAGMFRHPREHDLNALQ